MAISSLRGRWGRFVLETSLAWALGGYLGAPFGLLYLIAPLVLVYAHRISIDVFHLRRERGPSAYEKITEAWNSKKESTLERWIDRIGPSVSPESEAVSHWVVSRVFGAVLMPFSAAYFLHRKFADTKHVARRGAMNRESISNAYLALHRHAQSSSAALSPMRDITREDPKLSMEAVVCVKQRMMQQLDSIPSLPALNVDEIFLMSHRQLWHDYARALRLLHDAAAAGEQGFIGNDRAKFSTAARLTTEGIAALIAVLATLKGSREVANLSKKAIMA